MTPEILQENTWIRCIWNKNLLQDHFSNIHTSSARHVRELDQAGRVFSHYVKYKSYWNEQ